MIYAPHELQQLKLSPPGDFHSWEERKVARNSLAFISEQLWRGLRMLMAIIYLLVLWL